MRTLAVLIIVVLGGCLDASLVPCGDQLCPSGSTCVGGERCATAEQLAACDGMAEGAPCTLRSGAGNCESGVCVPTGCGNGILDPGEACDDGNTISGDGCRADCKKVEVCGDGVIDAGEGCDDGNTNPADGCDACVPTTWRATAVIGGNLSATAAVLSGPVSVALDRIGNLYIADANNAVIERVDVTGAITTVAGTGTSSGYSGDGGPAASAELDIPFGVAVDGEDNVYIADAGNNRIRRVDTLGVITTIAGTGTAGYNGDGIAATGAELSDPSGVAVDGLGIVYIADSGNHRIRRVDLDGTITTVAGTGVAGSAGDHGLATSAQLSQPLGIAIDGLGDLFLADVDTNRVRRIDPAGVITTVAGTGAGGYNGDGGTAITAQLFGPFSVASDGLGNLYIGDAGNERVRLVNAAGHIATVAGTGTAAFSGDGGLAIDAQLSQPSGVAPDASGNLYVADALNHRVRKVIAAGTIETVAGSGEETNSNDGRAATSTSLASAPAVAVDAQGNVYVADEVTAVVRRVDSTGVITTFAGTTPGSSGDGGAATSAQLTSPCGVAVDGLGNVYIADEGDQRIRRVDASGIITTFAGTGTPGYNGDNRAATTAQLSGPCGLAVDALGNLFIADAGNARVRRVSPAGTITTVAGNGTSGFGGDNGQAISAQLAGPSAVAVDSLGTLYISDANNLRVRRVTVGGVISTIAGDGTAGYSGDSGAATSAHLDPAGLAVDGLGNLYIADGFDSRVRRVNPAGVITTFAGTGTPGFDGDGGPATAADLFSPLGLAVDSHNAVFIADTQLGSVRRVAPSGAITTIVGAIDPEGTGPIAQGVLADPRALVIAPSFTLFASGSSGTVELARATPPWIEAAIGRYPASVATGTLARFRDGNFGTVAGVAYDGANLIYLTESTTNQIDAVMIVDPADVTTWTIASLNTDTIGGFADGSLAGAKFRNPTGLYLDAAAHVLYVADTGNHVIRAVDLSTSMVRTVAGSPATRGYFGDGGSASAALLFAPQALVRCGNGDLFVADTGNNRVRRISATTGVITTVLGDGTAASSGEGIPASTFPVNAPLGLVCDALGNLFVTSTTTVRLVPADATGVVDGTGAVQTIYGAPPRTMFPASVTTCLTGLAVVDATTIEVTDACNGMLVQLQRGPQ